MHDDDRVTSGPAAAGELVPSGAAVPDLTVLAEELVASAGQRGIALTGQDGLLTVLTRQVLQSALEAELAAHLGYDKHDPVGRERELPQRSDAEDGAHRDRRGHGGGAS